MAAQVDLTLNGPMDQLRIVWQTGEALLESVPFADDPEGTRYNVLLAVQEMVTNVLRHAYEMDEDRPLHISFRVDVDRVEVVLRDEGEPFDPTHHDTTGLGQQEGMPEETGGYGIYIAKMVMDEVAYSRSGTWNVLRMSKWAGVPARAASPGRREKA